MNQPTIATLSNGLRIILAPCEAESVAFGLFIASGSRHESAKTAGISHFIEHMLFKGTPTRRPVDISRAIEGRGGNFNACTGEESTCYYAHLPSEYLGEAVDILSDMYLRASIPADEFQREREVVIEEIRMYADEPDSVAMENLQRNIFPASRLGAPVAGSADSLRPLAPADLKGYIKSHYLPSNTAAVIVGAFDADEAVRLVKKALGGFRRVSKALKVDCATVGRPVTEQIVRKPDIHEAQLALGYRTFGIGDKRKYAATVMDAILGRGMSSRLFQEVREKRGFSYDISSRMQFFADAGLFAVTAGLDPKNRVEALKTIDRELKRISTTRVSAAELKRTKEFLIGNFRLSHEKVVSKLFFYGQTFLAFGKLIPPQEQIAGIRAVTADDILSAARAIFRPSNRSVSWVLPKA